MVDTDADRDEALRCAGYLEALAELAQLRGVALPALMRQLGLKAPAVV
jgi:hypothetical protein